MESKIAKTESALRTILDEMLRLDELREAEPYLGSMLGTPFRFTDDVPSRHDILISVLGEADPRGLAQRSSAARRTFV